MPPPVFLHLVAGTVGLAKEDTKNLMVFINISY